MSDLVEFLKARLDEDEADARGAIGGPWVLSERDGLWSIDGRNDPHNVVQIEDVGDRTPQHIARHDPARVLRETEAKRRIIRDVEGGPWLPADPSDDEPEYSYGYARAMHDALKILALPHVDHPDYREEWRPQ